MMGALHCLTYDFLCNMKQIAKIVNHDLLITCCFIIKTQISQNPESQ